MMLLNLNPEPYNHNHNHHKFRGFFAAPQPPKTAHFQSGFAGLLGARTLQCRQCILQCAIWVINRCTMKYQPYGLWGQFSTQVVDLGGD